MIYRIYIKRILDILLSTIVLIIFLPFFIIIAIAIKIDSRGPIFFTQDRAGIHGKTFKMYKFRTMLTFEDSYYSDGRQIPNYKRITNIGKILRKTSIDELPQFINIFIGNMSMVGPRPTLLYQIEKYDENQRKRLNVKPGLTGLAQINGRNDITWEEKIGFDLRYINTINFLTDLRIITNSISVVIKSEKVEFLKPDDISKHKGDIFEDVGSPNSQSNHY